MSEHAPPHSERRLAGRKPRVLRLVARTVWRAFPELDAYSDDECRAYIQAALTKRGSRVLCTYVPVAAALIGMAGMVASAWYGDEWIARWIGPWCRFDIVYRTVALTALLALTGGLPTFAALLVRDVLIWLRIRRALRQSGRCLKCGYTFVGLVIPPSLELHCPECGRLGRVDAALTVLARPGREHHPGVTHATPVRVVVRDNPVFWNQDRLRRWRKALAYTAAGAATAAVVGAVTLEAVVQYQVAQARAAMPTTDQLKALVRANRSGATFVDMPELEGRVMTLALRLQASAEGQKSATLAARQLNPNYSGVLPQVPEMVPHHDPPKSWAEEQSQRADMEEFAEQQSLNALAFRTLEAAEADGVFADLSQFERLPYQVRLQGDSPATLLRYYRAYTDAAITLAEALCARARMAISRSETAAAERSLRAVLHIAKAMREQGTGVETQCASHMEEAVSTTLKRWVISSPSKDDLDAIERLSHPEAPRGEPALYMQVELLMTRALIAQNLCDDSVVRAHLLGRKVGCLETLLARRATPGSTFGTWAANAQVIEGAADACVAATSVRPAQAHFTSADWRNPVHRSPSATIAAPIVRQLEHDAEKISTRAIVSDAVLATMLALERFRLQHGAYPDSLHQLAPEGEARVPLDPWSERPMGYRRLNPSEDALSRPYLLYSHGLNGTDDGGPVVAGPNGPWWRSPEWGERNHPFNAFRPIPRLGPGPVAPPRQPDAGPQAPNP